MLGDCSLHESCAMTCLTFSWSNDQGSCHRQVRYCFIDPTKFSSHTVVPLWKRWYGNIKNWYYKVRQLLPNNRHRKELLQNYYKCDRSSLHSASYIKSASGFANCDSYYIKWDVHHSSGNRNELNLSALKKFNLIFFIISVNDSVVRRPILNQEKIYNITWIIS